MPRLSVMTFVFGGALASGQLTDAGMLKAVEEMGLDGVELPSPRLLQDSKRRAEYKSFLADSRLSVTCIDGMCNLIGEDEASRQRGIDDLRKSIELAVELHSPIVLAAGSRLSGTITPAEGRAMTAEGLKACMKEASDAGVKLAIEDFGVAPTLQCAAAHCVEVMNLAPGVEFVFDTGNFYFAGEDAFNNLDLLLPRTCHVHVKDWVKSATPTIADVAGCALGEGFVRNREILAAVLAKTQVASFSLEVEAPGDKLEATRKDLVTIRQWLQ